MVTIEKTTNKLLTLKIKYGIINVSIKRKECFDMINWKQMFNAKERQDTSEDEWSAVY